MLYARRLAWLLAFIATALGLALIWENKRHTLAPVAWAVAVSAVATFFTLMYSFAPNTRITKSGMRNAITVTFVVTYFVLLGLFAFFKGTEQNLPPVTDALVTNFTVLMGVVIAFYFGTTTYEKVAQMQAVGRNPQAAAAINAAAQAADNESAVTQSNLGVPSNPTTPTSPSGSPAPEPPLATETQDAP